jgi:hypothetical protein
VPTFDMSICEFVVHLRLLVALDYRKVIISLFRLSKVRCSRGDHAWPLAPAYRQYETRRLPGSAAGSQAERVEVLPRSPNFSAGNVD